MGGTNVSKSWLWRETEFVSYKKIWCYSYCITIIILRLMLLKSSGWYLELFQWKTLWKWGQDKFCSSDSVCILSSGVTHPTAYWCYPIRWSKWTTVLKNCNPVIVLELRSDRTSLVSSFQGVDQLCYDKFNLLILWMFIWKLLELLFPLMRIFEVTMYEKHKFSKVFGFWSSEFSILLFFFFSPKGGCDEHFHFTVRRHSFLFCSLSLLSHERKMKG